MRRLSLFSTGARHQLSVAITLVVVIPLFSFAFVVVTRVFSPRVYSAWIQALISFLALVLGVTGFLMLRRYPRHIESLKNYLKVMAQGELPTEIRLREDMDDVSAIARYLNMILVEMRRKMELLEQQLILEQQMQKTIQAQAEQLFVAERHRVMIESLGTACHHIGQPATVLQFHLDSIARSDLSPDTREKVEGCRRAIEAIADILNRLRSVGEYRTIPYQPMPTGGVPRDGDHILDIGPGNRAGGS
ncbi:MAG: hypothetical protein QME60_01820 [Verrucomicrobiota bacterium]|nr:hypothetical protein [Verrucomicrobiota bacterium]